MSDQATSATPAPQRRSKKRARKGDVLAALTEHHGLVSVAARQLGIARSTIYRMMERHPDLAAAVDDARDYTTDVAEAALYRAIRRGEPWAVQFYLKTQGKRRGYVERTEVDDLRMPDLSSVSDEQLQAWLEQMAPRRTSR